MFYFLWTFAEFEFYFFEISGWIGFSDGRNWFFDDAFVVFIGIIDKEWIIFFVVLVFSDAMVLLDFIFLCVMVCSFIY